MLMTRVRKVTNIIDKERMFRQSKSNQNTFFFRIKSVKISKTKNRKR